jgi:5-methylthioribose kinase
MRELNPENTAAYLRESGRVPAGAEVRVCELAGGVSNVVLRGDVPGHPAMVLKQCRERLRVAMDWRARLDRIWAEVATLRLLGRILPTGTVPAVLFEDRSEYLFAMSCAPDDAVTWKSLLMNGRADPGIAARLGTILGTIHAQAAGRDELRGTLADSSLFDELRIDPYYRTAARAHPTVADWLDGLIESMERPAAERTLVLGDFSPKNILVHPGGLILLDFECGHAGDAAFDLGFFLSHLVLKAIRMQRFDPGNRPRYEELTLHFWTAYLERIEDSPWRSERLVPRALGHTAACLLARVDGKSPVEYLDELERRFVRALAIESIKSQPRTWPEMLRLLESHLERHGLLMRN